MTLLYAAIQPAILNASAGPFSITSAATSPGPAFAATTRTATIIEETATHRILLWRRLNSNIFTFFTITNNDLRSALFEINIKKQTHLLDASNAG
jgi:hypothetical protein